MGSGNQSEDIEVLLEKARKDGKITKSQRANWLRAVIDFKGDVLAIKELAGILGDKYNRIQKAWKRGDIPETTKKGTESSRCPVEISKAGAIQYILNFDGTDDFDDPRQRKLPF